MIHNVGEMVRPMLPPPGCRVRLVCGAPASGKSRYVAEHKGEGDIVIDLDSIAAEFGFDRERAAGSIAMLLRERNDRLARLCYEPPERTAWVILCAPSQRLRYWWCEALCVRPGDLVVLKATRGQLIDRILCDPTRRHVRAEHMGLVDAWLRREKDNDPGVLRGAVTIDGYPIDPLHPWNR